jgi:glycosyltransferase involved in cell wall biosynthesis
VNGEAAAQGGFWDEIGSVVRLRGSPRSRAAWTWLETVGVPTAAARARVGVLHSPANFGPFVGPFARVLTLHDVLFRRHPELLSRAMRLGTELLVPPAARRAHRLITVSNASRDDMVRLLGVQADRINVVPNGWTPPGAPGDPARARSLLEAGDRAVALSVASDLPHKKLGVLVDALALLPPAERPLVALAGHGTDSGALAARAVRQGVAADLRPLGSVDAPTLEDLYAAAAMVISPTLGEGFGLPVLEALGRGIPVACSDLPALREVAGECAIWFPPGDASGAADALRRAAAADPELERLRTSGPARAREFSWRTAAERTWEAYEQAQATRA